MASQHVIEATDSNFQSEVIDSSVPTVVDFWAVWCGPCRMIAPALDELANEFAGQVRVAKVNVDQNPNVAAQYGIRSIPTLVVIRNGEEVDRHIGAGPKAKLKGLFDRAVG